MTDIVLATLNARYHHTSFGLRYLRANLGALRERSEICEFTINQSSLEIVDEILARNPQIVGFGVYIWNVAETTSIVRMLKTLQPNLIVVLGGPEVSYETDGLDVVQIADFVIRGEADHAFRELCESLLSEPSPERRQSLPRMIQASLPQMDDVTLPYGEYLDEDLANRVLYVEASRGCPFTCEFCLSALDIPVRQFPIETFLKAMQSLLERGARQFKFVDRTFNLNLRISQQILRFFLARLQPGMFLHFELVPDRLPVELRDLVTQFPPGVLQFEIGIQTFDDATSERISRRQNVTRLVDNLGFLRQSTGVHLHTDLIVGLPGESLESFAAGFDRLVRLAPQEIQIGILKRLRGTPIIRHVESFEMVFNPEPPYDLLQSRDLSYDEMKRMRWFAKFWDSIANSGRFPHTLQAILGVGSAFQSFFHLSCWLFGRHGRSWGISQLALTESLFVYVTQHAILEPEAAARAIWSDYTETGRSDRPAFLRGFDLPAPARVKPKKEGARRQAQHLASHGK